MKARLALVMIVATGIAAPVAVVTRDSVAAASPTYAFCGAGYVSAKLPWGHKCLRAGEFCKIGNRAYLRYGFFCPATGHLRRR